MKKRIAFASGKGGTGKTTFAVNVAYLLSLSGLRVQVLDLDVEEPNSHIFLKPKIEQTYPVKVWVPKVDYERCNFCGECAKKCVFSALMVLPKEILVFEELCKSCKLCKKICKEGAIIDSEREVGIVRKGFTSSGIEFVDGLLNVREPMPLSVIGKVKEFSKPDSIQIIDCPPGTSCPFVKSTFDADFIVFVTEPTPFGLHDLKLCVDFTEKLGKRFGVVINMKNGEYQPLETYLSKKGIPILAEVPEDIRIAKTYSQGLLLLEALPEFRTHFEKLIKDVMERINE